MLTTILKPAVIDHSQTTSSKWWLPQAQGFLLFVQPQHERQAAAKHRYWYKATKGGGRRCLAAKSILYWNPGTCFLCYCTACPNGDLAHSATGSRPQEFPRNPRILTWGTHGYSQYKRSSWSRSVTMFIWAYTSYELQETNLMTVAPLIIITLLWDLNIFLLRSINSFQKWQRL